MLFEWCQWLEMSAAGLLVTESLWGFPVLVALHLLGLGLSVGMIVWMDLRLLGKAMTASTAAAVYRGIAPWALAGFALMFASGAMLFAGYATAAYANVFFRLKLVAMLVAGINAAWYHMATERRVATAASVDALPLAARATGLISIAAWLTVVLAGRAMSYTMF
jgi:hypothetical protein